MHTKYKQVRHIQGGVAVDDTKYNGKREINLGYVV